MAELRKCPFCGGEAEIWEDKVFGTFVPQCKECTAQHGRYTSRERAVAAWNTRKPMEAVVAELEKQVEQYDRRAEEHKDYEDYYSRYYSKARSYEHAISIVRGKERKYCGNCKHQPEPLTTCEWLKSQTQIIKECPRWEGKE